MGTRPRLPPHVPSPKLLLWGPSLHRSEGKEKWIELNRPLGQEGQSPNHIASLITSKPYPLNDNNNHTNKPICFTWL
jgi:hypothetical protein